jgi:hypothetical protein
MWTGMDGRDLGLKVQAWSDGAKPRLASVLDQALEVSKSHPEPIQGELSSLVIDF